MKRFKSILILCNLLLILGCVAFSVFRKEEIIRNGTIVLLRLAPVDPRSLMQGDYMRLKYFLDANVDTDDKAQIMNGFAVVEIGDNNVGTVVRLQQNADNVGIGQWVVKFHRGRYGEIKLGAESFFFEEGQADTFSQAVYGGLRIDKQGNSVLIGLYNKNFNLITSSQNADSTTQYSLTKNVDVNIVDTTTENSATNEIDSLVENNNAQPQ